MYMISQMFEKFSNLDIDSAGRGGEYTVQVSVNVYSLVLWPLNYHWQGWLWLDKRRGSLGCEELWPDIGGSAVSISLKCPHGSV